MQKRLPSEAYLTFKRAVVIAQGMVAAEKNTKQLIGAETAIEHVTHSDAQAQTCYRCGRSNHAPSNFCPKEVRCHNWGKKGHIAKVCRSKRRGQSAGKRSYPKQTKWVQAAHQSESVSDSDLPVFRIGDRSSHPITVDLEVQGRKLTMEVDTGAAVSIISEKTHKEWFPDVPLKTAPVVLRTYTGEPMPVVEEMVVEAQYEPQTQVLTLIVAEGLSLFGLEWLRHLHLDWKTIGLATLETGPTKGDVLLKKYEEVFSENWEQCAISKPG